MLGKLLPRNEHIIDRALRVVLGLTAIAMVFIGPKTPIGWIGLVPLVTGLVGSCPIYRLIGRGTCAVPKRSERTPVLEAQSASQPESQS